MAINITDKDDVLKGKNPHLALTHSEQGFSANNRPISLLMKSGIKLTDELIKSIETLGLSEVSEIKKAISFQTQKDLLRKAIEESFCEKDHYGCCEWCYVEDFDDANIVFWKGCELYQTSYVINADWTVTLGDVASPVIELKSYAVIGGELKINEEVMDAIEEGMATVVMKAFEDKDKSVEITKSYFSKIKTETPVEVEVVKENIKPSEEPINKNKENTMTEVVDFTKSAEYQELHKSLTAMQEELQKAREEKENILKAKEAEDKAAMLDVLKGYSFVGDVAEELNEVLFKNAASIKVLEVLEKAQAAISAVVTAEQGQDAPEQIAKSADANAEKDMVADILKARKAKAKK